MGAERHRFHSGRATWIVDAVDTLRQVSRPLDTIRKLPAVGVLAERQMGAFLALAALVGVGVGVGAAALVTLIEWVQRFLLPFAIDEGRAWIFLTVPTGLLFAWLLAKRFAPEVAGDGVPQAIAALEVRGGQMRDG